MGRYVYETPTVFSVHQMDCRPRKQIHYPTDFSTIMEAANTPYFEKLINSTYIFHILFPLPFLCTFVVSYAFGCNKRCNLSAIRMRTWGVVICTSFEHQLGFLCSVHDEVLLLCLDQIEI